MAPTRAATVEEYLEELPAERRAVVASVREVIRRHLPLGYRETVRWGMINYEVPEERYPETYNGQPLSYLALAAQKNNYSLYLTGVYQNAEEADWLREEFRRAGKKLDLGKSCLRFRTLDDLPLEVIGTLVERTPVDRFLAEHEASRRKGAS